jgi:hypothetical protein
VGGRPEPLGPRECGGFMMTHLYKLGATLPSSMAGALTETCFGNIARLPRFKTARAMEGCPSG